VTSVARRTAAPAACAAFVAVLVIAAPGDDWRPEWDSATYLLTARSLDRGDGYRYLGEPYFLRPPGFAVGLAALADDGAFDFDQLNRGVAACAGLAVLAVFLVYRREQGDPAALAIALLTGTSVVFVRRLDWVDSDFPFLLCLLVGAACFDAAVRGGDQRRLLASAGVAALAAALYLRTAALMALPGVALATVVRGGGHSGKHARWAGLAWAGVAALLYLPWALEASSRARDAERPTEQRAMFDYPTALLRVDAGDPESPWLTWEGWRDRLANTGARMTSDLTHTVLGTRSAWAGFLLGGAVLAGLCLAPRRPPATLEIFGVLYALLLLNNFAYVPRLLIPLLPVIYAALARLASWAAERGAERFGHPRAWRATAVAAGMALLALNAAALPEALAAGARPMGVSLPAGDGAPEERRILGSQADRWADYRRAAAWLRENTAEDAVLAADFAPVVSLLADRTTFTTRFQREPDLLERNRVDYAVCFWWTRRAFEEEAAARARHRTLLPSHFGEQTIRIYDLR
jgi:4-amino-4-deoxy-L-arabinose transferase-like glycosyltransferase